MVGGSNRNDTLATVEQWNLNTNQMESLPPLPEDIWGSAGVASKSIDYIGFVAGGLLENHRNITNSRPTNKVFGLRRRDLKWEVLPQRLQTARWKHSMVNVAQPEVPGC